MKPKVLSRGPELDTEKCIRNVGNLRYDLILIAAQRAREIKRQNKGSQSYEHKFAVVTALMDVQNNNIDPLTYLARVK
jgi:DNA-directed RNA polymerase subunit K/omega